SGEVKIAFDGILRDGRQHSNHGVRLAIHPKDFADDVRITALTLRPVFVTENNDGSGSRLVIGIDEGAAKDGPDAENIEEVSGYDCGFNTVRRVGVAQQEGHLMVLDDALKSMILPPVI